tara:strand:- start:483 stop:584 length:102 start_codon:yes stop_codon:yes gene_type:complete
MILYLGIFLKKLIKLFPNIPEDPVIPILINLKI